MRRALPLTIALALALVPPPTGSARAATSGHATAAAVAVAPIDGLAPPAFDVTTRVPEARTWFRQGMALCYAFHHEEAILAFERAAALDPSLAMAHWGVAHALGPNINLPIDAEREKRAHAAIQKARSLAAAASVRERDWIDAMVPRYGAEPLADRSPRDRAYADAMGALSKKYPEDLDAAVLYAEALMDLRPWQQWTRDGKPAPETPEILAVLESVLRRDPDHVGAIHFYIHAVEASPHPERALVWARRLPELAPAAGHLVHMPTHIQTQVGEYAESGRINDRAAKVDRDLIAAGRGGSFYPMLYYNHNMHMAAYAYAMAGRYADARRAAQQLVEHAAPMARDMPMVEMFTPTVLLVDVKFARWDSVLAAPQPPAHMPVTRALRRFARGMAFAATGRAADAEKERREFERETKKLAPGLTYGMSPAAAVMSVARALLGARIAEAGGRSADAAAAYRRAVAAEDSLAYDEPPDWYLHAREAYGAALLRGGDGPGAEQLFRSDLSRRPRNGRALFGLREALARQGRVESAGPVGTRFEQAWKDADAPLRLEEL